MHAPSRARSPITLILSLFIVPGITACLCGGGKKPDVDEVTRELATATQDERTVTISYRRTNRRKKQHMDQLFADDFYTITEAIWLESPPVSRFTLAVQSNREGKVSMQDPRAEVSLSPEADRVAYKLDDGPWRILFLVNDDQWLRAPPSLDAPTTPDWNKVPSLPDYTLDLYMHYDSTSTADLDYASVHRAAMLAHYEKVKGEEALVDLIFEVKDHPSTNSYGLQSTIDNLSEEGRVLFDARLVREVISKEKPAIARINQLLSHVDVTSPALREHVVRLAAHYATHDVEDRDYSSKTSSQLLLQAARQDLDRARELAEAILTTHSPALARPGKEGWLMRSTALTIIARSGKPAAIVPSMISKTPCNHGYAAQNGRGPVENTRTSERIEKEFAHGPTHTTYHQPQEDGLFVLGAMYATGQTLPESLRTLTCPGAQP